MTGPRVLDLQPRSRDDAAAHFFGSAANTFADRYLETKEENVLDDAIQALGPDASDDEILSVIQRTRGVSPQRKQTRLNQYREVMDLKAGIRAKDADTEYKKAASKKMDIQEKLLLHDKMYGEPIKQLQQQWKSISEDPLTEAGDPRLKAIEDELKSLRKKAEKQLKKIAPDLDFTEVEEVDEVMPIETMGGMEQQPTQFQPVRQPAYPPEQIASAKQELIQADAPISEFDKLNRAAGLPAYQVRRQSMIDKYGRDPGPSKAEIAAKKEEEKQMKKVDKFIASINDGRFPEGARRVFESIMAVPGMDQDRALQILQERIDIPGVSEEEMTQYYLESLNEGSTELDAIFDSIDRASLEVQRKRSNERKEKAKLKRR